MPVVGGVRRSKTGGSGGQPRALRPAFIFLLLLDLSLRLYWRDVSGLGQGPDWLAKRLGDATLRSHSAAAPSLAALDVARLERALQDAKREQHLLTASEWLMANG